MQTLRTFLDDLEGRLVRVDQSIDPITEAAALSSASRVPYIADKLKGFPEWKLTDILVSSRETQAIALNTEPDRVVQHLASFIRKGGWPGSVLVGSGPCKDVIIPSDEVDIRKLPIPIHSVGDGGEIGARYLGSGIAVTKDRHTGVRNNAFIRMQVRDNERNRVGFWMAARHNWNHYMQYENADEYMPIAFVVGLHPAYDILSAFSGEHPDNDEFEIAADLLGERHEVVKCETIDLEVPAHAELVIEGLVPPHIREPEGPFGEFTGFKGGKVGDAPVMEVTAITHRTKPIFRHVQATVFTDHQPLGSLPMEAAIYDSIKGVHGGVQINGVHIPAFVGRYTVIISMTAKWDGQAAAVGFQALNGVYMHPKIAIIVDEDVDIYDAEDVMWAVSQRVNPQVDVHTASNQRIHPLDQSAPILGDEVTVMRKGGKMVVDATKPATWRMKAREDFERVKPSGHDHENLKDILSSLRLS